MKPRAFLFTAGFAVLSAVSAAFAQQESATPVPLPSGPIEVNGIAAKVNGRVITKNEVAFLLAPDYARLVAEFPRRGPEFERQFKEVRDRVIQELIDREIILDEFKQMGASIRPHLIDEEIRSQIQRLYNGDEAKFREELKKSRLTMDRYREMTREKMIVSAMRAQQFADAPPPLPGEIQKEYQEVKPMIRDTSQDVISFKKIFIPRMDLDNPLSTPETQLSLAEELAGKIRGGADFEELAKEHSADAYAAEGGLQEDVPRTDLAPEFAAIVFDAEVGELVGPLEDPVGFTLVIPTKKVLGPSPPLSDSKVRAMIEERVKKKKTSVPYERWIESRRKRAMIELKD